LSNLTRLIGTLRYAGMRLTVEDDRLIVTGATDRLTDRMAATITQHKPAIIAALNRLLVGCVVPHVCMDIGACHPGCCEQASCTKPIPIPYRKETAA